MKAVKMVNQCGDVHAFECIADAATALGLDKRNISQSIQKQCKVGQYYAQYAPIEAQDSLTSDGEIEKWLPSCVDPDCFRISSMGRVQIRNAIGNGWGFKVTPSPAKAMTYAMVRTGKGVWTVHRVVIETFQGRPNDNDEHNLYQVDHMNRIKSDNRLCNLRWATISQNMQNRTNSHSSVRG